MINDSDPSWLTSNINIKINYHNNIHREYLKKGKQQVGYVKLQNTIKKLSELNQLEWIITTFILTIN